MNSTNRKWVGLLLIWGFLAFCNNLFNPFVFDDLEYLAKGPGLASWADFIGIFAAHQTRHALQLTHQFCYQLHQMAGFKTPLVYHIFNNGLHLATGIWFYFLCLRIFSHQTKPHLLAFLAAAFFLVHPLQVESVSYISGRSSGLCSFFIVGAIWFFWNFVETKKASGLIAALVLTALAAETKELAMVIPFFFVLIVIFSLVNHASAFSKEFWLKFFSWTFLICLMAAGLIFIWRRDDFIHMASLRPMPLAWMSQSVVFFRFVLLLLFPYPLCLDRSLALIESPFNPLFLGSLVLWCGVGFLLFKGVSRARKAPIFALAVMAFAWFFLGLLPTLIFPPDDLMSERWAYLSIMGGGVAFALAYAGTENYFSEKRLHLFLAILVLLTVLTWQRNWIFGEEVRLWTDTVAKAKHNPRAFFNLGQAHFKLSQWPKAIAAHQEALRIKPSYLPPRLYLGLAYEHMHQKEAAYATYRELLQYNIHRTQARFFYLKGLERFIHLGLERRDFVTVEEYLLLALRSIPPSAELWHNLGKVRLERGLYPRAKDAFRMATELSPTGVPWNLALAGLYLREKNFAKAESILSQLNRSSPNQPDIVFQLAMVYDEQGVYMAEAAEKMFEHFLRLEPTGPRANFAEMELKRVRARLTKDIRHR